MGMHSSVEKRVIPSSRIPSECVLLLATRLPFGEKDASLAGCEEIVSPYSTERRNHSGLLSNSLFLRDFVASCETKKIPHEATKDELAERTNGKLVLGKLISERSGALPVFV